MASLADRTKELRTEIMMDQARLSRASGISQATISRIESGLVTQPKSETLQRLAEALGVSIDYLVGRTDAPTLDEMSQFDESFRSVGTVYYELTGDGQLDLARFAEFLADEQKRKSERDDAE